MTTTGIPNSAKCRKFHIFNEMLEKKLGELKIKVKSRPVEIGYEVRCQTPVAYDLVYCSLLGMGTYKLFSEGKTGCMVYADPAGQISPLYLKDLQDPGNRQDSAAFGRYQFGQVYDGHQKHPELRYAGRLRSRQKYVPNPEAFDFYKILEWNE